MMNITFNLDDELIAEARKFTKEAGTSLNAVVRESINDFIKQQKRERALANLKKQQGLYDGEKFNRDELYDRFS